MKFEKNLLNTSLNNNSIAKYIDDKKVVLVHVYKQKEINKKKLNTIKQKLLKEFDKITVIQKHDPEKLKTIKKRLN